MIDKETLLPVLENILSNFMQCTQMMFGPRVRYSITFKHNQPGFDVFRKKYQHGFKCLLVEENYNKSIAVEIKKMNSFMVTQKDKIHVYDSNTFMKKHHYDIDLKESTTREINQIIGMKLCQNE
jgi:hypothetical protein